METQTPADALSQFDPGKVQTDIGFYETLFFLHDQKKQHCIPAVVKKYDRLTGLATVQPLVKYVYDTVSGQKTFSRPEYSVQVHRICHGGFTIDIPLFVGDTGWLVAGDRHAELAMAENSQPVREDQTFKEGTGEIENGENKGEQPPDDCSLGDFAWGFFIPCYWGAVHATNEDGVVIRYDPKDAAQKKEIEITASASGVSFRRGSISGEKTDTIVLDDDGLRYEGEPDRTQNVVTDIRYDTATHQFQRKVVPQKVRGDFVVGVGKESGWEMIEGGQAVPEQDS